MQLGEIAGDCRLKRGGGVGGEPDGGGSELQTGGAAMTVQNEAAEVEDAELRDFWLTDSHCGPRRKVDAFGKQLSESEV